MQLMPRKSVPDLELKTLDGPTFELSKQRAETFTMVVFYRGLHCPVCRRYLNELDCMMDEFRKRGGLCPLPVPIRAIAPSKLEPTGDRKYQSCLRPAD
jgi:thiol-disulfide isomerase/thioredoxin